MSDISSSDRGRGRKEVNGVRRPELWEGGGGWEGGEGTMVRYIQDLLQLFSYYLHLFRTIYKFTIYL